MHSDLRVLDAGGYQQSDRAVLCISVSLRLANLVCYDQAPLIVFGYRSAYFEERMVNHHYEYESSQ